VRGGAWWLFLSVLFALATATGRHTLAMFVIILALATLVSERWGRDSLHRVRYRRYLGKSQLSYGEETSLVVEITNAKLLPLAWIRALDAFPLGLSVSTSEIQYTQTSDTGLLLTLVSLRWFERVRHTHRVKGVHRGRFAIGPVQLSSADIFGFSKSFRTDSTVDYLTVYPKIVPVEALTYPAGRPVGEWLGRRRVIEDPLRFSAVREYRSGDNPRYIHWRASARTGDLQTKTFEPSETVSLMLAVDVETSPQAYTYVPELLELVLSAAASIAVDALQERYMVGMFMNAIGLRGESWVQVSPGRHERQASDLLSAMAMVDAFRGAPFLEMLRAMRVNMPYGASVVAITTDPSEETYEALSLIQEAGHPVLLLTVGDMPPVVPERLDSIHLGGSDAWQRLENL